MGKDKCPGNEECCNPRSLGKAFIHKDNVGSMSDKEIISSYSDASKKCQIVFDTLGARAECQHGVQEEAEKSGMIRERTGLGKLKKPVYV
jgi:hypothetical protein